MSKRHWFPDTAQNVPASRAPSGHGLSPGPTRHPQIRRTCVHRVHGLPTADATGPPLRREQPSPKGMRRCLPKRSVSGLVARGYQHMATATTSAVDGSASGTSPRRPPAADGAASRAEYAAVHHPVGTGVLQLKHPQMMWELAVAVQTHLPLAPAGRGPHAATEIADDRCTVRAGAQITIQYLGANEIGPRLEPAVWLMACCGLRIGESLGVFPEDIVSGTLRCRRWWRRRLRVSRIPQVSTLPSTLP